ncbi:UTRA domain-containing protein [Epidermidibacterium keratini]|uniref:UTRA domain-containing protein n=1 Tax=Epidermidibacterium keratini TaxID=1891644 RepID=A0A7L4YSF0_9ACTN|nr:GntR family transcriptional regulator [Epidermidibacterium keratini]QHC02181.1 UTRA domain-containing protein [Epidermidibacterium keratini]
MTDQLRPDEIVSILSDEIAALSPGDRIESEHTLMKRFGVGRSVVRSVIGTLQSMHLVRRVQGSGTFVNRRIDYVISRSKSPSLHKTVEASGAHSETVLIGSDHSFLPAKAAARLELPPDTEVQHLTRLSHINGLPAMYVEEWILPGVCDHVDVAIGVVRSVDETLRGMGFLPIRAWCQASLDVAPAHARQRLELDEHDHTWVVESIARDRDTATALFHSRTWTRQDAVRLVLELDDIATS